MRAKEFIIEYTELPEMAGEIHGGVRKVLQDKGYKYLGSGIDKQAYLEPSTGQALIIFGYRKGQKDFSPDQRMFIDWINYCNANEGNPHLPKFSGFESFEFRGKKYIQARMEPLRELPPQVGEIVDYIDSIIQHLHHEDLTDAFNELSKKGYYDEENDTYNMPGVAKIIEFLGGSQKAENLLRTVYDVDQFGFKHGFRTDLHRGNYMARNDGTIVVNDPFVVWLKK